MLFDFLEMLYLFACYYAIHVVNLFLTMGVYAEALREKKIRRGMLVLCTLLAFGLGMLILASVEIYQVSGTICLLSHI